MTSHRETKRARQRARSSTLRLLCATTLFAGVSAWIASCATADTVTYGDGDCIGIACQQAGATSSSSSSSSAGGGTSSTGSTSGSTTTSTVCTVDMSCAVKWGADIYTAMFDQPATTGCTAMGQCHGAGKGGILLEPGKPHEAYVFLKDYVLLDQPGPAKKYIVPCDKAASGILCNAKPAAGMTNEFGACGSLMPLLGTSLTTDQITKIADWIACGAPEN